MNAPIDPSVIPYVLSDTRDGVRTLTLNRGERYNALSRDMLQALERTNWVQTQAAEVLNMSFRSFRYYAKKVGITARRDGTDDDLDDEMDIEPPPRSSSLVG